MTENSIRIAQTISVGDGHPLLLISGPCVIESEDLCVQVAQNLKAISAKLGVNYVFKASFDKANRTSAASYRGPGLERGLEILKAVKEKCDVPVLTDIHDVSQVNTVAEVVDILQIPAFLCRQTDLLRAAGESEKAVNIKKGQFMAPQQMAPAIEKVRQTGNKNVFLTERGHTFGYGNLVVDMRSLVIMRSLGVPVVFDASHSVQLPGGQGNSSGGQNEFIPYLSRAAAAVGIDGLFLECHPNPAEAKSDGPNSVTLESVEEITQTAQKIHELVRERKTN